MIDLTKHSCSHLVLRCIDFRFHQAIDRAFQNKLGQFDSVALAGASKAIHKVLDDIKIAVEKHDIKSIHIVDHVNCGAFGGKESVKDHRVSLTRAKKLVSNQFPNLAVKLYLANVKDGNLDLQQVK